MIYGQQHVAALVGPLLAVLGAAVVFICLTGPINAMLQAVGRADIPMKIILAGGLIKLGLNVILVLQPGSTSWVPPTAPLFVTCSW